VSVVFAARLREQPSFSHLHKKYCEATAGCGYGVVCFVEAVKNVARQHGAVCRVCVG
jgi:hypothetical protein